MSVIPFPGKARRTRSPAPEQDDARPARRLSGLRRHQDLVLLNLAERGSYYRSVIDAIPYAIISLSTEGVIRSWNRKAEMLFGYSEAEVENRPISFLAGIGESKWCSDQPRRWQTMQQRRDGRLVNVSIESLPIRDAAGKPLGVTWIVRNIGKRV